MGSKEEREFKKFAKSVSGADTLRKGARINRKNERYATERKITCRVYM